MSSRAANAEPLEGELLEVEIVGTEAMGFWPLERPGGMPAVAAASRPTPAVLAPTKTPPAAAAAGSRSTVRDMKENPICFDLSVDGLRYILQKKLRKSDVGSLGRIVLPKKESEAHLPHLAAREGITLTMDDLETMRVWSFKFRFWPNNRSRMYILENTGDFIRGHGLDVGDLILLYKDDQKDKYVIRAKKAAGDREKDGIFDAIYPDIPVVSARYSDLFSPLGDGTGSGGFGLGEAFSADLSMSFADDRWGECGGPSASLPLPGLDDLALPSLDDLDLPSWEEIMCEDI